jgi:YHS domain-containing protein
MRVFLTIGVFVISVVGLRAQSADVRAAHFNIKKGIAIEGYDPVSYYSRKPVEGKAAYQYSYRGITYRFDSEANMTKFKGAPEKYEPAFGGWCAYAMGENGEKVKIDPETYKIIDERLYLFYNFWGNNTLSDWNKNEKALKEKGENNWKKFVP